MNSDLGSTQILTRHYSAKSQTVSQLESLGTTPTSKSPQFSPSGSSKHLSMRSTRKLRHFLTTQMELWGFIKSLAQNKAVHMELSLHVSFYLRRSLRGYTVGTNMGFPVGIMEALAPQPRHQIPQMCQQ